MEPQAAVVAQSRLTTGPDPVTIGLSMVNWLVLMLLMCGYLLASTTNDGSTPAGSSAEIGAAETSSAATR
ncbi:hypothetical protein [Sporichthya polymorpha]|uniref:hypothetical protein n=1 Tax=Sporichthya polymorpha TaxID=35751 RepID=UPI00037E5A1F|nr:hypothetical protein [Sporichthya polymorpha]